MSQRLPNLRSLQVFEAAARLASFKLAATELHVTPAAVSRQIKGLEEALGFKLFERQNRRIRITGRGARYAEVIGQAFGTILTGTAELMGGPRKSPRLTLLVEREFATRWLLPNLHDFKDRYIDADVEIIPATDILELPPSGPRAAIVYRKLPQLGVQVDHLL
eukprot:gene28129-31284_t